MKKIFLAVALLLAPSGLAFADGFTALAPIPGLTDQSTTSVVNSATLAQFLNNLYIYLIGVAGILAVIMIIWHGIEIAFNRDSVGKVTDSKGKIMNAIYGLILVLSPALVFSIINPSILNLSLNLPPLNAAPGSSGFSTATIAPTTTSGSGGCTVTGAAGVFEVITCPTSAAVQNWIQTQCSDSSVKATPIPNTSTNAYGNASQFQAICMSNKPYMFIETQSATFAIHKIEPVSHTSNNPNNGTEVMTIVNGCSSIGWETCISDDPAYHTALACPTGLTGSVKSGFGGCYQEMLSCESGITATVSGKCSKNPGWTIFN